MVVTRPAERAAGMVSAFEAHGCSVVCLPAIRIEPAGRAPLRGALEELDTFDWVVFTSVNGVRHTVGVPDAAGSPPVQPPPLSWPPIAAVGPSTAKAVRDLLGRDPALVPAERFSSEGLVDAFGARAGELEGSRVLLLLAAAAADTLADGLRSYGAEVHRVDVYDTLPTDRAAAAELAETIRRGEVDLVTFTSPSTVSSFLDAVGDDAIRLPAAVIGPVTGRAARDLGFEVAAQPERHTVDELVQASLAFLGVGAQEVDP